MAQSDQPLWTSVLTGAMLQVGFKDRTARQAIARMKTAGWLDSTKDGRRTLWEITENGKTLVAEGSSRVSSLQSENRDWNGDWLVLHISVPENMRPDRQRLYRVLKWNGLGSPTSAIWLTPHVSQEEKIRLIICEAGVEDHTIAFIAKSTDIGITQKEIVTRAWDLDQIQLHYADLVARFSGNSKKTDSCHFEDYIRLVNAFQRLPSIDPGLPEDLLHDQNNNKLHLKTLTRIRRDGRRRAHDFWRALVQTESKL